MREQSVTQSLETLLANSKATAEFKEAVRAAARGGQSRAIAVNAGAPPVKIMRTVMKILEEFPETALERVRIDGVSGCSTFTGTALIQPGDVNVDFVWDCRWQAQQLGWTDYYGDPDQGRAAREMGYQCFKAFEVRGKSTPHTAEQ